MKLKYRLIIILCRTMLLFQGSQCQQAYLNDTCTFNATIPANLSEGYLCPGGNSLSCNSLVAFRPRLASYSTVSTISQLLGADSSATSSLNGVSPDTKLNPDRTILVPLSCACPVSYFQHFATYSVKPKDSYYIISGEIYNGLTTCKALASQNPSYHIMNISLVSEVIVRIRCACPSANQTANGVKALVTFPVASGDTASSIGAAFGVSGRDVLEANMLSEKSYKIVPGTPLLVPLKDESCSVNPRMFFCGCPDGERRTYGGSECVLVSRDKFPIKFIVVIGVGIGLVLLVVTLSSYKLHLFLRERKEKIKKDEFFKRNGGVLLQEKLSTNTSEEKARLFSAEELQRATDNYNQSRFLGEGGFGSVYKGMLPDGTVVAVKNSKGIGDSQIEQFINEVVVLSRIDHRNIVKLLGFCLETETPILVYEFVPNGTLSQHIRRTIESSLSWENRLKIACDVAGALSYMHSSASIPIFHRDIKSSNVLLDDKYNAKISDFGTSRPVPEEKTHLTTTVQGTLGYMDPEYFQSSKFTDKSDVYSFGVTLVELLTGENPYSFYGDNDCKNLVSTFISLTKEGNGIYEIVDPRVAGDMSEGVLRVMAELAVRCLRLSGKKRPTMKQVSSVLEGLRNRETILEMEESHSLISNLDLIANIDDTSSTTKDYPGSSIMSWSLEPRD